MYKSHHTPRPVNSSIVLPIAAYAGVYNNPGYGTFNICTSDSTSEHCREVLAAFATVDAAHSLPYPPSRSVPQLFVEWDRFWSSHVRLVHFAHNTFNVSFTALFPQGYGKSNTPFETYEMDSYNGQAEFLVDKSGENVLGFGLFIPDGTGQSAIMVDARSIRESSAAWFEKI